MKKFKVIFAFAAFTFCLGATQMAYAVEDRNTKIKAEMAQNYLLWQEAYKNKDAGRIISFEAPEFTYIPLDGQPTMKEESDNDWRDIMKEIRKVHKARIEINKLTIEPNRVVILSSLYLDVDQLWDGKMQHISSITYTRDIWIQYDSVWMLKRTEDMGAEIIKAEPISLSKKNHKTSTAK